MEILADFTAIGVRHLHQQKLLMERAGLAAEAAMANKLAHKINNPLQGLTNILFMAKEGYYGDSAKNVGLHAARDLERLSSLVSEILRLPLPK
jgi:signal transduction histidine kinase